MDNALQLLGGTLVPTTKIGGETAAAAKAGAIDAQTLAPGNTIFGLDNYRYVPADGVTVNGAVSIPNAMALRQTTTIQISTEGNSAPARVILFDANDAYKNQACNSCNSELDDTVTATITAGPQGGSCGVSAYQKSFLGNLCRRPRVITAYKITTESKANNVWTRVDASYNVVVFRGDGMGYVEFQDSFNTDIHEDLRNQKPGTVVPMTGKFSRLDGDTAWDFGMIDANKRITITLVNFVETSR